MYPCAELFKRVQTCAELTKLTNNSKLVKNGDFHGANLKTGEYEGRQEESVIISDFHGEIN
jgi:hypothetical protein